MRRFGSSLFCILPLWRVLREREDFAAVGMKSVSALDKSVYVL